MLDAFAGSFADSQRALLSDGSCDFNRALPSDKCRLRRVFGLVDARPGELCPMAMLCLSGGLKPASEGVAAQVAIGACCFDEQTEDRQRSEAYEARSATEGRCASVAKWGL